MSGPLAIMDYGIGGIDLLVRIKKIHPDLPVLYFSDSGYVPYGKVNKSTLRKRVYEVINFLKNKGAKHIVVACHSASSVIEVDDPNVLSIRNITIRSVLKSSIRKIGIIGGGRTIRSGYYRKALKEKGYSVEQRVAQEMSILIERGELDSSYARNTVLSIIRHLRNMDGLLLACTHYPALSSLIQELFPQMVLIDPIDEVCEQLIANGWLDLRNVTTIQKDQFFTTGNPALMIEAAQKAFHYKIPIVHSVKNMAK